MNEQDRINAFTLAAHRAVVARLRAQPALLMQAIEVLERWREQTREPAHCGPYWNEWEALLRSGVDAVERAVCDETEHAATLRSVSPLGRFISPAERHLLRRQAREAA
ncbi:hypothetical protein [Piscinibacter sp.]|jgi:hypothetical protein|uniref:hypothetical protein n=1 Tax=Piscinibacter sp. TaxID=1903157 RepID=UPI00355A1E38